MINPSRQVRSPATRAVLPTDLCIILTPSVRDFTASAATSPVPVLLMGLDSSREIWLTPFRRLESCTTTGSAAFHGNCE